MSFREVTCYIAVCDVCKVEADYEGLDCTSWEEKSDAVGCAWSSDSDRAWRELPNGRLWCGDCCTAQGLPS